MKLERRVYLYAFDEVLRVVDTKFLMDDAISIVNMVRTANWMRSQYPQTVAIYAIDNRRGLYAEYLESIKAKDFTKNVEFADTVRREGVRVG